MTQDTGTDKTPDQLLQDFSDLVDGPPLTPTYFEVNRDTEGYKFYLSVRSQLPKWWKEFTEGLNDHGRLRYRSVWSMIKVKTKSIKDQKEQERQRDLLWQMLGPSPEASQKVVKVPWLGDWDKRRSLNSSKLNYAGVTALRRAWERGIEAQDAAKHTVPLITRQLARVEMFLQTVDEVFGGMPFNPNLPPDSPQNVQRVNSYLGLQGLAFERMTKLFTEYYRALGVPDPAVWSRSVASGMRIGGGRVIDAELQPVPGQPDAPTLDGVETKYMPLPAGVNVDDLLMAKMLRAKAQAFKTGLPGEYKGMEKDLTPEEIEKAKKKGVN